MEVRCPVCEALFDNEGALQRHLEGCLQVRWTFCVHVYVCIFVVGALLKSHHFYHARLNGCGGKCRYDGRSEPARTTCAVWKGGVVLCIYKFPFSIINTSSFPPSFTIFNNCQSLHTLQRKKIADERDASRKNPRRSRRGGGTDSVEAEPLLELKWVGHINIYIYL